MKPIPLLLLVIAALISPASSQDEEIPVSTEIVSSPGVAQILGDLPDGTPAQEVPKPGFTVRPRDVLESETIEQDGRKITIQRICPIKLPPPVVAPTVEVDYSATQQEVGDLTGTHSDGDLLFVGASVYHAKDSPVRTLVTLSPPGGGDSVSFWSSADFALLSGFASFVASDGVTRSLMLAWSRQEVGSLDDLTSNGSNELGGSKIPPLPEGIATFTIIEGKPDKEMLTVIKSLHDLYNTDYERLKSAYESREAARVAKEAELLAHPPKLKSIVLNSWRIGDAKPAPQAQEKGGAR